MSMNAIDTFLPAAPKAGRNPSDPNPARQPESGDAAVLSDSDSFGAQLSQTSQTRQKPARNITTTETTAAKVEPGADAASNEAGTVTQAAPQARPAVQLQAQTPPATQTSAIALTHATDLSALGRPTQDAAAAGATGKGSPSKGSPGEGSPKPQLNPANGLEQADAALAAAQQTVPTTVISAAASQPQMQQAGHDSGAGQDGVAATSQTKSVTEAGDTGTAQIAVNNAATPTDTVTTEADTAIATTHAATQNSGDSAPRAAQTAAPPQPASGTIADATASKPGPAVMDASDEAVADTVTGNKVAQSDLPPASDINATLDKTAAMEMDADVTTGTLGIAVTPAKSDGAQMVGATPLASTGQNAQPGTAPGFAETQVMQSEGRLKADAVGTQTATPLPAAGGTAGSTSAGAAGAAQTVTASDTAIPSSGTGTNNTQALSANTAATDTTARLAAIAGENPAQVSETKSEAATPKANSLPSGEAGSALAQTTDASRTVTETPQRAAPPPPPPSPPIRDLSMQITRHVEAGTNHFQMRLDPPELGRVDIRMQIAHDGKLSLVVAAERPETIDLLQRDARVLERSLQDAGLKTDSQSLNFSLKDGGRSFAGWRDGDRGGDRDSAAGGTDDGWEIPAEDFTARRRFTDRAVNIRI